MRRRASRPYTFIHPWWKTVTSRQIRLSSCNWRVFFQCWKRRAIYFTVFFCFNIYIYIYIVFQGGWLFGFLAFVACLCGCCGSSFRVLCIHSSSLLGFCGFGFSHPLHYQFLSSGWLFGFVAFGGFLALAFRILCFPSWFLALASCILSIARVLAWF